MTTDWRCSVGGVPAHGRIRAALDAEVPRETVVMAIVAEEKLQSFLPCAFAAPLGNGTQFELYVGPHDHSVGEWGGTGPRSAMVAVRRVGAWNFDLENSGMLSGTYVAEKLTRNNLCDGTALAFILGIVLKRPVISACHCPLHVRKEAVDRARAASLPGLGRASVVAYGHPFLGVPVRLCGRSIRYYHDEAYCGGGHTAEPRLLCLECGQERPDDERVAAGMKCGQCAYGTKEEKALRGVRVCERCVCGAQIEIEDDGAGFFDDDASPSAIEKALARWREEHKCAFPPMRSSGSEPR